MKTKTYTKLKLLAVGMLVAGSSTISLGLNAGGGSGANPPAGFSGQDSFTLPKIVLSASVGYEIDMGISSLTVSWPLIDPVGGQRTIPQSGSQSICIHTNDINGVHLYAKSINGDTAGGTAPGIPQTAYLWDGSGSSLNDYLPYSVTLATAGASYPLDLTGGSDVPLALSDLSAAQSCLPGGYAGGSPGGATPNLALTYDLTIPPSGVLPGIYTDSLTLEVLAASDDTGPTFPDH